MEGLAMLMRNASMCFVAAALAGTGLAQSTGGKFESKLVFESSHPHQVEGFNWAKQQALACAFNGDQVGPWYEAALPGRETLCMRDVSHQAMGAHALGLARHDLNIPKRFAENISEYRERYTHEGRDREGVAWACDFLGESHGRGGGYRAR